MADHELTLMAVHAHPDDEATSTGGILARYAAEGIRTVLVTCTDGSCGDGPGGVKPGEPGHDPAEVVAMRQAELEASCAILGVTDLELLGYADSGMVGWPQNDAPGSFWGTPVDVAAARLAGLMDIYRPDVVVTYDENGFYGHPDHIQAHRITMAAADASGIPAKVYWTTIARSRIAEFETIMREFGLDELAPDSASNDSASNDSASNDSASNDSASDDAASGAPPEMGLPDDQISTWVDIREYADRKFDSLAAHASQGDNIFFLRLGRERFAHLMGVEAFLRVRDRSGVAWPEDDLFAGLR